jgi:hypothetical protein
VFFDALEYVWWLSALPVIFVSLDLCVCFSCGDFSSDDLLGRFLPNPIHPYQQQTTRVATATKISS